MLRRFVKVDTQKIAINMKFSNEMFEMYGRFDKVDVLKIAIKLN